MPSCNKRGTKKQIPAESPKGAGALSTEPQKDNLHTARFGFLYDDKLFDGQYAIICFEFLKAQHFQT